MKEKWEKRDRERGTMVGKRTLRCLKHDRLSYFIFSESCTYIIIFIYNSVEVLPLGMIIFPYSSIAFQRQNPVSVTGNLFLSCWSGKLKGNSQYKLMPLLLVASHKLNQNPTDEDTVDF